MDITIVLGGLDTVSPFHSATSTNHVQMSRHRVLALKCALRVMGEEGKSHRQEGVSREKSLDVGRQPFHS